MGYTGFQGSEKLNIRHDILKTHIETYVTYVTQCLTLTDHGGTHAKIFGENIYMWNSNVQRRT